MMTHTATLSAGRLKRSLAFVQQTIERRNMIPVLGMVRIDFSAGTRRATVSRRWRGTQAMITPKLRPCPFCGSEAALEKGPMAYSIECAKGSSCIGSGLLIGFMHDKLESAVSQWNAREGAPALSRDSGE